MNFATTGNSVAEIWLETCDKNSTPHAVRFFQAIQWPWLQDCVQIRLGSRCVFECLFNLFCSQPLHMFASIYTSWWFQTN